MASAVKFLGAEQAFTAVKSFAVEQTLTVEQGKGEGKQKRLERAV